MIKREDQVAMAAQQELFDLELHEDGALEEDIGDDAIDMDGMVRTDI